MNDDLECVEKVVFLRDEDAVVRDQGSGQDIADTFPNGCCQAMASADVYLPR